MDNYTSVGLVNNTRTSASRIEDFTKVFGWISFAVGLPATGLALYTMRNLVRGPNPVPVSVVSILVSDVLNLFGRLQAATKSVPPADVANTGDPATMITYFGVVSNVTFMVCAAQERHLLVVYPEYYSCCSKLKQSSIVSLSMWLMPFALLALVYFKHFFVFAVVLLTPFPLLLFFFLDTWRSFLWSRSALRSEKQKTVVALAFVLTNYMVLFLPFILNVLLVSLSFKEEVLYLGLIGDLLLYMNPLVDPFLYIFMTKGPREVVEALLCCKRNQSNQSENMQTVATVAETVTETRL
ncbi:adrenocorticotropic hormone receptor [Esox lucius]|uniref:adrenocorticotropic hormone receptor n=1 Tax=Esox lucius TaxID=8010 RepID=UPI001476FECE|nr:adrenocorticotropic hormone receptor [Esox lucius]